MPTFKPLSADELTKLRAVEPDAFVQPKEGMNPLVRGNALRQEKLQRVAQMGFNKELLGSVSKTVQNLSIVDLEDLAKRIAGVPVENKRIDSISIEDLQGIEMLFREQRELALVNVAVKLQGGAAMNEAASVDVSCCCCTPCCCCAATETNPFAA